MPAEAIAYDELRSVDRPYPFTGTCEQLPDPGTSTSPGNCVLPVNGRNARSTSLVVQTRERATGPRYFLALWNGLGLDTATFHRRMILDGRYYAVETYASRPTCELAVDTGSGATMVFSSVLPAELAAGHAGPMDRDKTAGFMADNCPLVEKFAVNALRYIDPDGGSLLDAGR